MRYCYSILLCYLIIGIAYNTALHFPDEFFKNVEGTLWEYNDCGKVVFVDRTTSNESSRISYYVTYESEYFQKNHTLKTTPYAYQSAKQIKNHGGEICFGIDAGPNVGWGFLLMFIWASIFICGFMVLRWGRFLLLNKDYKPSPNYYGY